MIDYLNALFDEGWRPEPNYEGKHRWPELGEPGRSPSEWGARRRWQSGARRNRHRNGPSYTPRHLEPEPPWEFSMLIHPWRSPGMEPVYYDREGRLTLYSGSGHRRIGYIAAADAAKLRSMQSAPARLRGAVIPLPGTPGAQGVTTLPPGSGAAPGVTNA